MPSPNYQTYTQADLLKHNHNGDNVLHAACRDSQFNDLKLILERAKVLFSPIQYKAYINTKTAAHHVDGKSVDAQDTALMLACCHDESLEMISHLLDEGADVSLTSADHLTPLHRACLLQKPAVISKLLSHNDSWLSLNGDAAALGRLLFYGCQLGHLKLVKCILESMTQLPILERVHLLNKSYPAWSNGHDIDGELSPLEAAYRFQKNNVAIALISERLVDVNISIGEKSLLFMAFSNRKLNIIHTLLKRHDIKVDFNINGEETLLGFAIRTRLSLYICTLLAYKCMDKINIPDESGFTALDRAVRRNLHLSESNFIISLLRCGALQQQTLSEVDLSDFKIAAQTCEDEILEETGHATSSSIDEFPVPSCSNSLKDSDMSQYSSGGLMVHIAEVSRPRLPLSPIKPTAIATLHEVSLSPAKRSAPPQQAHEPKRICTSSRANVTFFAASTLLSSSSSSGSTVFTKDNAQASYGFIGSK